MRSSGGYIFILIWAYSQVAQAYTKFEPECTNPKEAVNFVASPPTRGLYLRALGLFYISMYQNRGMIGTLGDGGDLKWGMKATWNKTKWMLTTVLAPEALMFFAFARLASNWKQHPALKAFADADGVPWTLAHTTFANMGGFVVRGSSDRVGKDSRSEIPTTQIQSPATKEWYILDSDTILRLRSEGHIVLPCIPKAEIDDHSKGDIFTKGIAAVQIIWTIASAITRAIRGLAISQLEVSVIAFSVCALIIYASYWSSPKDVSVPITFLEWGGPISSTITEIIKRADPVRISTWVEGKIGQIPFSNMNHPTIPSQIVVVDFTPIFGALFFGAPHLLAWNLTFPTPAERIAWRAASLYCCLVGIILYSTTDLENLLRPFVAKSLHQRLAEFITYLGFGLGVIYILARLFMIVETFRTLLFLPPSAYIATWTANVPMFS